jgi:deazaflavin-dependent oxidoreductase (nitroreductase family)
MWFDPLMIWLLKSPLHGLVSRNLILLTITGRKSGRLIATPANYLRSGNTLWVISWRDRKWWRNLRGGAEVPVRLAGKALEGRGQVIEEEKAVAQSLSDYYRRVPKTARYVRIGLDSAGQPIPADCELAAQKMVTVRIDLY